jgi:phospholipid/cholesterol/gamma-HCH transport system permease protein
MINTVNNITGWSGSFFLRRLSYVINLVTFSSFALHDWFKSVRIFDRYSYRSLVSQIIFSGIDAMPTILFLALVTGFVFTFRMIALFDSIVDTVTILNYVIALELGPMIAAIVLISRTGSAITVDLGNMKLHKEIEALELMGINVNNFLVAPRILGVTVAQLSVSVFFTMVTLGTGILLSGLLLSPTYFKYFSDMVTGLNGLILFVFVIKNLLFGLFIGAIACYHGLKVDVSPTEVPQQTQRAIVNSILMLFIIDGVFAVLMI